VDWQQVYTSNNMGFVISLAETTNDRQFAGNTSPNDTAIAIWGAQVEQGAHVTSYVPTTSAAVARPKDSLAILPYKLNKMLQGQISASPKLVCGFDQDASGATMYSTTNYLYASTNFANLSYWATTAAAIESDKITAPDGTVSGDFLKEDATNTPHYVFHATLTISNATAYCFSVYLKPVSRSWVAITIADMGGCEVYLDLANKRVGSSAGGAFGGAGVEDAGDGWCRCWVWGTSATTVGTVSIKAASGDGGQSYQGLSQSSIAIWGAQLEKGNKPSFFGFTGNAFTLGRYTLTKVRQPQPRYTEQEGFFHELNGTTDCWKIINGSGGSDFNFSGSFTIIGSFTPTRTPVGSEEFHIINKISGASGYCIYMHQDALRFYTHDGTASTVVLVTTGNLPGHPIRFMATFEDMGGATNNKMRLYVNGLTAATTDAGRKPASNSTDLGIGASASPSGFVPGRLHELSIYNSYVATQAEHNAAYAAWKVEGILPPVISNTTTKKKLRITFDAKAEYIGAAEIGGSDGIVLDIAGTVSGSDDSHNRIFGKISTSGKFGFGCYDSAGTVHLGEHTSAQTIFDCWRTYSAVWDFSSMANMAVTVDGSASGITLTGNSGTATLDLRNSLIYVGEAFNAPLNADAWIRNIQLSSEE
jgi:hypothetical protein